MNLEKWTASLTLESPEVADPVSVVPPSPDMLEFNSRLASVDRVHAAEVRKQWAERFARRLEGKSKGVPVQSLDREQRTASIPHIGS